MSPTHSRTVNIDNQASIIQGIFRSVDDLNIPCICAFRDACTIHDTFITVARNALIHLVQ